MFGMKKKGKGALQIEEQMSGLYDRADLPLQLCPECGKKFNIYLYSCPFCGNKSSGISSGGEELIEIIEKKQQSKTVNDEAAAFFGKGEFESAKAKLIDAIKLNPYHEQALANLGYLFIQLMDYDSAEYVLDKALDLNPKREEIKRYKKIVASSRKVKFLTEESQIQYGENCVYRTYSAPNKEIAADFLEGNYVYKNFYYLIVQTPSGKYCKDIQGVYEQ